MSVQSDYIWFNGKLVPWSEANVHVMTHALHYGLGIFEGIRAYKCLDGGSAVFRLKDHMHRFAMSAHILRMDMPFSEEETYNAVIETLKANKQDEAYVRPLAFIGAGNMGIYPGKNPIETIVASWFMGPYLGEGALEKGIRVKTSTFIRHHPNAMMTKAKAAGNYVNSILAKMEAVDDGYDEAMLLDSTGFVSEATGENMFIVRNGVIKTTPLTSVLDGITRNSLITVARDLGYEVVEQQFTRDEVYVAEEAFFCGTAAEVTPICEVDRRVIGKGSAGPVTKHIQEAFFKAVKGGDPKYAHWLDRYEI